VYSTVDVLMGSSVQVHGAETALDDVLRAVKEVVPLTVTTMEPELHYRAGAIAKYGILDITFGLASGPPDLQRPGIGILRSLGLVDGVESSDSAGSADDFLRDLVSEAEAGELCLKVFLDTGDALPAGNTMRRLREGMPSGFWPHLFFVRDACLTSARSIWLAKHFYM
jgi:hypothetical protein